MKEELFYTDENGQLFYVKEPEGPERKCAASIVNKKIPLSEMTDCDLAGAIGFIKGKIDAMQRAFLVGDEPNFDMSGRFNIILRSLNQESDRRKQFFSVKSKSKIDLVLEE